MASRTRRILTWLGLALLWPIGSIAAQDAFPSRPITIIIPFAAGGPTDVVARLIGPHLERTLGQPILIENVGGAGGTSGMVRVALASPDGYTLGIGNAGTQSAAPALYPNLKYDPAASFDQISILNHTPMAIVGKQGLAATTLPELLAYLKANHAASSQGHAGVGSTSHMAAVVFNSQFGFKPGLVAYRGTGPAMNDLVGGQFDYMIDQSLNVIPQIKAGTIRAFAIAAPERLASLPDVPTAREVGVDFVIGAWNAFVAPKGLPASVRQKLVEATNKALDDPAIVTRLADLGSTPPTAGERGPAGLQKLVESELARMTPILKAAGITAN